jgi:ADP-ribose 1''-phosphate phosphatase
MTENNVTMILGDLFSAPPNSVLIRNFPTLGPHSKVKLTRLDSCNCVGSWRSGVALAFKKLYPAAHKIYASHCAAHNPEDLVGTALLIPPQPDDGKERHWVGCLFTSISYGRDVDAPEKILHNTEKSLRDLKTQWEGLGGKAGEWHAAKINSVRFKVPWEKTREVLQKTGLKVVVYEYEEKYM